ncbi:hypothetical protein Pa4123_12180 [Phytohabitans aurantiacus]|jgi:hypothetical protein|uniref:Flavodoxin-like domain-containing protein n=1 Tax=Phytohabitans aurantiacus TaxID=3016789 RepID=A0ABQ5QQQ1_9ACTN|nr:hypothetical protein Pa4123_12180 [Phytohabitans aurantiacus]
MVRTVGASHPRRMVPVVRERPQDTIAHREAEGKRRATIVTCTTPFIGAKADLTRDVFEEIGDYLSDR